jgi:ankyrin repeat protein
MLSLNTITAVRQNDVPAIQACIGTGVNVDDIGEYGDTLLMYACKNEAWDVARYLMDAGANLNIKNNRGATAMNFAMFYENEKLCKEMIAAGFDINHIFNQIDSEVRLNIFVCNLADLINQMAGHLTIENQRRWRSMRLSIVLN